MITIDKKSLDDILKRFDKAPDRMQYNAMRSVGRAGANVVKNYAKAGAPSYLASSVKTVARSSHGRKLLTKFSVAVGGNRLIDLQAEIKKSVSGMTFSDNYPAIWVEFGTYGRRDYQGTEPYSPETLKKKSYASGRSDSPYWGDDSKWIEAKPFMRPAINDHVEEIEKAMVEKLDDYLKKKGL